MHPDSTGEDNREAFARAELLVQDHLLHDALYDRVRSSLFGGDMPPRTIGRFTIVRSVGAGAMGRVYAAYDDRLDRGVAIKVLRRASETRHQHRLVREAQALAKLSHPNIVPVFEVGTHEGQLYMVMELVRGESLRHWLAAETRSIPQIVAMFEQAGRGLAAAHHGGIVHRDFKPDNVVVGDDGRVRVLDFGLARADLQSMLETNPPGTTSDEFARSNPALATESGALVGTPAYMAPEVMRGREVTPRADQFGFAVSLWEALYGQRPFEGDTVSALMRNVTGGRLREPPPGRGVPSRLKRVLLRGLATDPDARFESMEALLTALGERRRKRAWIVAGAALTGIGGWWLVGGPSTVCEGADRALGPAWDEARRAAVEQAFVSRPVPYANKAWQSVAAGLDEYASGWVAMYRENCEATHRFHRQSAEMMTRRVACLADRRRSLDAVTQVFTAADDQAVNRSLAVVGALPSIEACRDERYVMAAVAVPETPERQRELEVLKERLARAQAEHDAGHREVALEMLQPLLRDAEAFSDRPFTGRVRLALGTVQAARGDAVASETLTEAYETLLGVGDDEGSAKAAATLVYVFGWQRSELERAKTWLVSARGFAERLGGDLELLSNLALHEGQIHDRAGALPQAEEALRRSVALSIQHSGPSHVDVAADHSSLGAILHQRGKFDEAREHLERAVAIWKEHLGPEHPEVAIGLNNLAALEVDVARYDAAQPLLERAIELWKRSSPDQPEIAVAQQNLGIIHDMRGDYRRGEAYFRESLEFRRRVLGSDHVDVAASLVNLGTSLIAQERFEEARGYLEEALAIRERKLAPGDSRFSTPLLLLGDVQRNTGEYDAAEASYRRAREVIAGALGAEHPGVANIEERLGKVAVLRKDDARAVEHYERAVALVEKAKGVDHPQAVGALLGLVAVSTRTNDRATVERVLPRLLRIIETQTVAPADAAQGLLLAARWQRKRGADRSEIVALLDAADRHAAKAEGRYESLRADLAAERRALR